MSRQGMQLDPYERGVGEYVYRRREDGALVVILAFEGRLEGMEGQGVKITNADGCIRPGLR